MVQRIGQRCLSQPGQTQISALLKKKTMVTFQRVRTRAVQSKSLEKSKGREKNGKSDLDLLKRLLAKESLISGGVLKPVQEI